MFGTAAHFLLSPLVSLWLANSSRSWRQLPTPGERPIASGAGPNADRVLLVGAGIAVGYGVTSPELALGGQLARRLVAITGRGASIDTVARFGLRAKHVRSVVSEFDLARFDTVLLTVGSDEALHLMTVSQFRKHVEGLLCWIDKTAPAKLAVVMVGLPDVTSLMKVPRVIAAAVRARCRALDAELKLVCAAHPHAVYLPFHPLAFDLEASGDRRIYETWANLIAPGLARVLNAQTEDPRDPATILERRRQHALDALYILDTEREPRFDRIVASARKWFGVSGASITFIDRDRQWSKSSVGIDPCDSPRGSALGDATVHNGKLLVVEDARSDDRFRGHPWVAGNSEVRFFAGFPLESSSGERIGALCLTDGEPRSFSPADDAMLGVLARQVEHQLWGVAP